MQGGKAHKHLKFPTLQASADGRRLLAAVRQPLQPLLKAGGAVTEAELVVRSGVSADTPHKWGWRGLAVDAHQDRKTGFITFERVSRAQAGHGRAAAGRPAAGRAAAGRPLQAGRCRQADVIPLFPLAANHALPGRRPLAV